MSYTVELSMHVEFSDEEIEGLLETAGYAIGYWAKHAEISDETYKVTWEDEHPGYPKTGIITFQEIADALCRVAFDKELSVRSDLGLHAVRGILEDDPGEWDGEIADVTVQVALFGEIVYG